MKKIEATCSLTGKKTTILATSRDAAATEIFDTLGRSFLNRPARTNKANRGRAGCCVRPHPDTRCAA